MEDESVNNMSLDTALLDTDTEDDGTPVLVPDTTSTDWSSQVEQERAADSAVNNFDKDFETTIPSGTGKADIAATRTTSSDEQAEAFLQNVGTAWKSHQANPSLIVHIRSPNKDWTTVQPHQELQPQGKSKNGLIYHCISGFNNVSILQSRFYSRGQLEKPKNRFLINALGDDV